MVGALATDGELLDDYVHHRDSASFQAMVSRHGPAVQRACRAVLRDEHEAEDAAQATFLVLARRAPEIRDPERLGGWLRGVAHRVATRARRRVARRREIEKARAELCREDPGASASGSEAELREVVGDELRRLPEDYRRPIELCYLDGLTHQEAARRLEWPVGTVKVRLVRGRRVLRERLNRRGVALGSSSLLMLWHPGRRADSATDPPVAASPRVTSREVASRRVATCRGSPRPAERAGGIDRAVRLLKWTGPWAAAIVVAASLGLSIPAVRALAGPPAPEVDPATVPANLADVLNVECR